jgi:hypothetical protein
LLGGALHTGLAPLIAFRNAIPSAENKTVRRLLLLNFCSKMQDRTGWPLPSRAPAVEGGAGPIPQRPVYDHGPVGPAF